MLSASPWEAEPFLNGDGGRADGEEVNEKGEGIGGEEEGKLIGM